MATKAVTLTTFPKTDGGSYGLRRESGSYGKLLERVLGVDISLSM